MFFQLCLCSAKWRCFYWQVFQISLLIQRVIALVVDGSVGKSSVVGWLVGWWSLNLMKPRKRYVWSGDFTCAVWSRFILFFCSIFIFFYIVDKEKINLIARKSHSNLYLFLKICKYYKKTKPIEVSPNIYFIYKKLLHVFLQNLCLVKEFFLVNPLIGFFWGILRQVSQQLPRKTPLIFGIFFNILPICCCYLVAC